MAMYSNGTESYTDSTITTDKWVMGGCPVSYKNIQHPLIQEFFTNLGATAQTYKEKYIKVTGTFFIKGSDLHNFLMLRTVNLKENPNALDTVIEPKVEPVIAVASVKPLSPSYDKVSAPVIKPADPNVVDSPSESSMAWIKSYLWFGKK